METYIAKEPVIERIYPQRLKVENIAGRCDLLKLENPDKSTTRNIVYIPGLAGDTMVKFIQGAKKWVDQANVFGVLHSGIIDQPGNECLFARTGKGDGSTVNNSIEVTADDWVRDVKVAILHAIESNQPLDLICHSFGGIFAIKAIHDLIAKSSMERYRAAGQKPIRLILISVPTYVEPALPDRRPLLGTDQNQPFSFYHDANSLDAMSTPDDRIPMASMTAFDGIHDYLLYCRLIAVEPDKEQFNQSFRQLITNLPLYFSLLKDTDIQIASLHPYQDRWVSKQAGECLERMIGRYILIEKFDIDYAFNHSTTNINAHDAEFVNEWMRVVAKIINI